MQGQGGGGGGGGKHTTVDGVLITSVVLFKVEPLVMCQTPKLPCTTFYNKFSSKTPLYLGKRDIYF